MTTEDRVQRLHVRCITIEGIETMLSTAMMALALWAWFALFGLWTGLAIMAIYALARTACNLSARRAIDMIGTLTRE